MKIQTVVLMFLVVFLTPACATMSSKPGDFSVSGITGDPARATAIAGSVTTRQYDSETQRLIAMKMVDRGMNPAGFVPGSGYMGYGNGYGVASGDYWFNYRSRGIVPYVQQPAQAQRVIVTPGVNAVAVPQGSYATKQDLAGVEEKADDSLCMHYKKQQKELGKPVTKCPRFEKK